MDVGKCWQHAFAEISNEAGTQSRSKGSNSRWPAKAMGRGAAGANIEQALISPNQDSIEVSRVMALDARFGDKTVNLDL